MGNLPQAMDAAAAGALAEASTTIPHCVLEGHEEIVWAVEAGPGGSCSPRHRIAIEIRPTRVQSALDDEANNVHQ
jgi:hypothetical protein